MSTCSCAGLSGSGSTTSNGRSDCSAPGSKLVARHGLHIDDAVTWARLNPEAPPSWWATRLSLVRRFAAYLHANDVDVPVIPSGLLAARKPDRSLHLQPTRHRCVACRVRHRVWRRADAATLRTVIGLLAATGLRIGEALKLRVQDIDQQQRPADDSRPRSLTSGSSRCTGRRRPPSCSTSLCLPGWLHAPTPRPGLRDLQGTGYVYVSFQSLFKQVREAAGLTHAAGHAPVCTTSDTPSPPRT